MASKKDENQNRGGARKGAGRKKGSPNSRPRRNPKGYLCDDGILAAAKLSSRMLSDPKKRKNIQTPLEFLLTVANDTDIELKHRLDAAKAASKYVHPSLAQVESTVKQTVRHEDALAALDDEDDYSEAVGG